MFDKRKAAQYFVVAWVKGWTIRTYLGAIGCAGVAYEHINSAYPWMPDYTDPYFRNVEIKAWAGSAMRSINDSLWDAKDDKARLALSYRIESFSAKGAKLRNTGNSKLMAKVKAEYSRAILAHRISVDAMRRGSGHAWNVCK